MPTIARFIPVIAALLASALCVPAIAQGPDRDGATTLDGIPDAPLEKDPAFVTGELASGLRYIIVPTDSGEGGASLALVIASGALDERDRPAGTSVVASRLVFDRSASFASGELEARMRRVGVSLSRRDNVTTYFDSTIYNLDLLDDSDESLELALSMLADVAHGTRGLTFDADLIARERDRAANDLRAKLDINHRVSRALLARVFPGTPYATHPPGGTEAGLAGVTDDHVRTFVAEAYTPDRMTLIVAGGFAPGRLRAAIDRRFPDEPIGAPRRDDIPAFPSPDNEPSPIVMTEPELPGANVLLMNLIPEPTPERTMRDLARSVAREVAMDALKRRAEHDACVSLPIQGVHAFAWPLSRSATQVSIAALTEADAWRRTLVALAGDARLAHDRGFSSEELRVARREILAQLNKRARHAPGDRPDEVTRTLARVTAFGGTPMLEDTRAERAAKLLGELSDEQINGAYRAAFDPKTITTVLIVPDASSAPDAKQVRAAFDATHTEPRLARGDAPATFSLPGEASIAPVPTMRGDASELIEELEIHPSTGVLSAWLRNRVRLHHLRRDDMDGRVVISFTLAGGRIMEGDDTRGLTLASAAFFEAPATPELASCDTRALLDARAIDWRPAIRADRVSLEIECPADRAGDAVRLLAAALEAPRLEARAMDKWKSRMISRTTFRGTMPRAMLDEAISDALYPLDDPRHRPLSTEEIRELSLDDARAWLARLCAESPIEAAIVGDISRAEAMDLGATYLGALSDRPRIDEMTSIPERLLVPRDHPVERHIDTESMSSQGVALIGFRGPGGGRTDELHDLDIAMRVLAARLDRRLDEADIGATRVRADAYENDAYPDFGLIYAYAEIPPEARGEAMNAIEAVFAELAYEGPTSNEIRLAKRDALNELSRDLDDPEWWAERLSVATYRGTGIGAIDDERDALQAVTDESIARTLRAYHDSSRKIAVSVTPRSKSKTDRSGDEAGESCDLHRKK